MASSLSLSFHVDELVERFRPLGREVALRVALAAWDKLPVIEQAALAADWRFWARPKQLPPAGKWRTWGFLTGRGFGKTIAIAKHVNEEVEAGRARLILLLAQDEASSIDIQVLGPSGLIATAPPWSRPAWEASALQLVWPNGARAYVRTPEVPGKIRGLEYHLAWISELQSWPKSTREEAFDNVFLSTRLGDWRVLWDSTPKRRHPLLKALLAKHEADPKTHAIVRGTTHENATNLGEGYVEELQKKYAGTLRGREELLGEMLSDAENALVSQAWIDAARRNEPGRLSRQVISIDPAVSNRPGSDTTGIVRVGELGGQAYVLADASGQHDPGEWGSLVLDWHGAHAVDCIIAETNKGGSLVAQNLRTLAQQRGLEVLIVGKDERPLRQPGKVYVKEVYARGSKEDRAEPIATAYEKGRISHVNGADLASLEDTLTTWEPPIEERSRKDSPGDLDALVHACVELLDLQKNTPDPVVAFKGLPEAVKQLAKPTSQTPLHRIFASAFSGTRDRI